LQRITRKHPELSSLGGCCLVSFVINYTLLDPNILLFLFFFLF
jgi:hypothetical protein